MPHTEPKGFDKRTGLPISALHIKKLPRSIKTINDLLAKDNVNEVTNIINDKKPHIKTLIAIYINDDDTYGCTRTDDVTNGDLVYYLELIKNDLFNDTED